MKLLIIFSLIVILFFALRMGVHYISADKATGGPVNGQLAPCPDKPNCHAMSLTLDETGESAIDKLQSQIEALSGTSIESRKTDYLHATFRTRLMGYTDDLEILAGSNNTVQIRSASRIGHSDLGANKKRVLSLLALAGFEVPSK